MAAIIGMVYVVFPTIRWSINDFLVRVRVFVVIRDENRASLTKTELFCVCGL